MVTASIQTLHPPVMRGGGDDASVSDGDVRMAIGAILEIAIPVRLLGPGPIALRIIVQRGAAVIQEIQFTIDPPAPDFAARHWRV